jgi:Ca2+-binding EF-hand superfamily protein
MSPDPGNGTLSFDEFVVGVWNYSTYDIRLVTKLAFDIFDVEHQGELDLYECDAMLRMVYDVEDIAEIEGPPSGPKILEEIDVNGDGVVSIDEFSDLMETNT